MIFLRPPPFLTNDLHLEGRTNVCWPLGHANHQCKLRTTPLLQNKLSNHLERRIREALHDTKTSACVCNILPKAACHPTTSMHACNILHRSIVDRAGVVCTSLVLWNFWQNPRGMRRGSNATTGLTAAPRSNEKRNLVRPRCAYYFPTTKTPPPRLTLIR